MFAPRIVISVIAAFLALISALPAQSASEAKIREAAEALWRSAVGVIDAHGDDRPVLVFPLISPPVGMSHARIVGASDVIHERVTMPARTSAAAVLRNRILGGQDLANALRQKGIDPRSYSEPVRADFIGSALARSLRHL
ncbi:MAG: hypothetical protein R3F20_15805 [Planctomycetota bacterium]